MIALTPSRARLTLSSALYEEGDLRAAALAVAGAGQARMTRTKGAFVVELAPSKRGGAKALAAEFAAEALAQAYRRRLLALSQERAAGLLAGALERGFAPLPADPLEQLEPQVAEDRARDTAALLARAEDLR